MTLLNRLLKELQKKRDYSDAELEDIKKLVLKYTAAAPLDNKTAEKCTSLYEGYAEWYAFG